MTLPLALLAALIALPGLAQPGSLDPFRVGGQAPTRVEAAIGPDRVAPDLAASPMLARLAGHLGDLGPRDLVPLRRALGRAVDPVPAAEAGGFVLHLARGDASERVEIRRGPDGGFVAVPLDGLGVPPREIGADAIAGLPIRRYRDPPADAAASARLRLTGTESTPSSIVLDEPSRRRIFRANYPDLTRDLTRETVHVRLPRGWRADRPSGVLLWVSPVEDGRCPQVFEPALDELNLIAVSADRAHNERALTDRLQLCLDAVETARSRFLVDDARIYVTGMSGGGRCSTILQCCLPEVFTGAVPIVGIDSYHNAPTGSGNLRWPARFAKPDAASFALLKTRRIRGITGDQDFNEPEMTVRTEMMERDGLEILLDVYPGMGHTMPTAEQFAIALRWVDEPSRAARDEGLAEARRLLASVDPADPDARATLIEVTRLAPWSELAWEAAGRLGFERP